MAFEGKLCHLILLPHSSRLMASPSSSSRPASQGFPGKTSSCSSPKERGDGVVGEGEMEMEVGEERGEGRRNVTLCR